jgi:non-structural maintenance of chromosomes element 3
MKNGSMIEHALIEFLKNVGIPVDDEQNTYFGHVKSLIQDQFVKQLYLKRTKVVVEGLNVDRYTYTWGERAEHEMEKKVILESICKLIDKSSVCYMQQREAAYGPEEQNNSQTEDSKPTLDVVDEEDEEPVPSTSRSRRRRR